ncbi:Activator of Hsp90 ATPase homolog 1-like protein [Flavobacterium caeni]|uniref:Activator of Hsp90 ATPase homolog 1-like protein n=1 Tax=Flavobacterium caeni TaxID=490189 RepID=A0A1G5HNU4_9FLAO|nr:Activator of Hsp90 ATPase homolog 1-like protein [Flavobacterium caeni]
METRKITVETTVHAPVEKVWAYWSEPEHIMRWCQASDDWHAPHAENDLRAEGKFTTTMAAKDGSFSFDFGGRYTRMSSRTISSLTQWMTGGRLKLRLPRKATKRTSGRVLYPKTKILSRYSATAGRRF